MDLEAWYRRDGFANDFHKYPAEHLKDGLGQGASGQKRRFGHGTLHSGAYCLDEAPRCDAYVQYESKAIVVEPEQFEELWDFGIANVAPTRNPMNKGTFIKRLQATFGSDYRFGNQHSQAVGGPDPADWPEAVRMALEDAKRRSSVPDTLTAVHTNWYPNGNASLMPHTDKEDKFIPGMPIYSYTLLSDPNFPRGFQIYRIPNEKDPEYDIKLGHGDLLVMAGDMQQRYKHGVKKTSANDYKNLRRINMTVRSVKP